MTGRQHPPRKRTTPLPPPPPLPDRDAVRGARALDELLDLHTPGTVAVALCRECMTAYPCRTRALAEAIAGPYRREDTPR